MIVQDTKLVVVPGNSPYETFQDLVDDIKARPGEIKLSYSGPGASGHIVGLLLGEAGLSVSATPFGGGGPAMLAAISGEVDLTFGNYGTVKDYLETGELRALAVLSNEKSDILPDLPAISSVLPELEPYLPMHFPNCFIVKKGTPQEIKDILTEAISKATLEPEWTQFVEEQSYIPLYDMTPDEIDAYWDQFTSITSWLLYDSGAAQNSPEDFGIERYIQK
jgi:tripartite-type tricarboxylate transporter receptor subunit TctC